MSVVTSVTLHCKEDRKAIEDINSWLGNHGYGPLHEVAGDSNKGFGGNKHPQIEVWGAGYNYFTPLEDFIRFVQGLEWKRPENVVLIINPEEGGCSVYYTFESGR